MITLTRLNNHLVVINPDHIRWAEASPDTTLFLLGGERILIRETIEQLIERVVEFRRLIRQGGDDRHVFLNSLEGDPPRVSSHPPRHDSSRPASIRVRSDR